MPTRDIRSGLEARLAFLAIISTDTTTNGAIIDTADFDRGIVFSFLATLVATGTFTPILEESDDSGMSGATDVTDAQLIGTEAAMIITDDPTVQAAVITTLGCFSTKRYLRFKVLSASTSGSSTIVATVHQEAEMSPQV